MLLSDICRRAETGGILDSMLGSRLTSAFMSLRSSSSWFSTERHKANVTLPRPDERSRATKCSFICSYSLARNRACVCVFWVCEIVHVSCQIWPAASGLGLLPKVWVQLRTWWRRAALRLPSDPVSELLLPPRVPTNAD